MRVNKTPLSSNFATLLVARENWPNYQNVVEFQQIIFFRILAWPLKLEKLTKIKATKAKQVLSEKFEAPFKRV